MARASGAGLDRRCVGRATGIFPVFPAAVQAFHPDPLRDDDLGGVEETVIGKPMFGEKGLDAFEA
jgi:hypothetical protein